MERYAITTFGCQMNAHDSERMRGMLEELGLVETHDVTDADVVVMNTCTIREKPDQKLYSQLSQLKAMKLAHPDRIVAVGGCLVEAQRERLFERFPFVDVAFGPGRIDQLGEFVAARIDGVMMVGSTPSGGGIGFYGIGDDRRFAADLPVRRERTFQAWVQVSMGCNMSCTYCIVPSVRGRQVSRPFQSIVDEVTVLASNGVREVTLLGQNVNSYGRDLPPDDRVTFAQLLALVDGVSGIERVRFTSPHPKDMREDVIDVMARSASICEHVHLPVQSGSSRVLKAMRRTYDRDRFLALVDRLRSAMPDIALTTDIIVGFPGETEEEFLETVSLCEQVRFDGAYTFIFSPRSGTDAADMPDLPYDVKRERLERLIDVVRGHALERHERFVSRTLEVLVEGPSRATPTLMRGRTRHNITVNFDGAAEPGDLVDVVITGATSETLRGVQQGFEPAQAGAPVAWTDALTPS